ncbi:MAG: ATP-dependent helicase, partial [Acidimicrobiia bacterium]
MGARPPQLGPMGPGRSIAATRPGTAPAGGLAARPEAASLLDGLTEAQVRAVTSDGAPLVILAGAGSGKTRVLTRRIAYRVATGDADPRHVLALTFTRKAAGELRSRLSALGVRDAVAAGTFHAIAYAQLRRRWADTGATPPTLLDRKVGFVARLVGPRGDRDAHVQPIDLVSEIEWAKARHLRPDAYEAAALLAGRRPPLPVGAMAGIYARYEDEKRRRGMVDFDDLLLHCVDAFADPAFAAAQRWRFRHLFVDEFQDLNPVQAALLGVWRGDRPDLCVVGDPNQAIYGWNGADPAYLRDLARREPGATVVELDDNFRSSPQILTVAAGVLGGGGVTTALRPHRADGPVPSVQAFATERDEARGLARSVRARHRPGTPWRHIAVLARTNAQLVTIQEELRAVGIPFRVRGGGSFLQRPEVQAALADLRRGRGPLRVALTDLRTGLHLAATAAEGAGGAPPSGRSSSAGVDDEPHDEPGAELDGPAAERQAVLAELVRLADEHLALDPEASVDGFVSWLATALGDDTASRRDAVELASFHAAKGLEWPVVFLAGLERGLVPIGHAKTDDAVDEERRLLYVAVTRAEEELHCTWAAERTFGDRTVPRQPSPWLDDIEAARRALAGGGSMADQVARISEERRRLRAGDGRRRRGTPGRPMVGDDADPAVLAALKAWRSGAARAAGVPAYGIFHDTTLAAVAEARPDSRATLLAQPGLGPVKAERYGDDL